MSVDSLARKQRPRYSLQRGCQVEGLVLVLAVGVGSAGNVVSHRNVCVQADAGKREGCGRKKGRTIREKIADAAKAKARKARAKPVLPVTSDLSDILQYA